MRKVSRAQEQHEEINFRSAFIVEANQYIKKQGDSWVIIQKGTGKVLSHHDSKAKAEASFAAMMSNKHGSIVESGAWPSETDWESHLKNLETLLSETQMGVGWHAAKDEKKEMKAHAKASDAIGKAIDAVKEVMKFNPAKK